MVSQCVATGWIGEHSAFEAFQKSRLTYVAEGLDELSVVSGFSEQMIPNGVPTPVHWGSAADGGYSCSISGSDTRLPLESTSITARSVMSRHPSA